MVKSDAGPVVLLRPGLQILMEALRADGYTVVAPVMREGAIVYGEVTTLDELPAGWTDEQDAGHYRLRRRDDEALFGFAVGPQSWKKYLHPERLRLWRAERDADAIRIIDARRPAPKFALLGVRSCELHAMAVHDTVFLSPAHADGDYAIRREHALIIAVNCIEAGGTCFCTSMDTGPEARAGYDLVLTEIIDDGAHRFLAAAGSAQGERLLEGLPQAAAREEDLAAASAGIDHARRSMGRSLDTVGIKSLLQDNPEHPRWDAVAERCLSCANCTLVCPTCFCTTIEDTSDLGGDHAERWRHWDSCFTLDFSYLHGGSVRQTTKARYRQWLTHKLAHWVDQFGTSGCVGCGRCVTWCPVGIDLTEEVAAMQASTDVGEVAP